MPHLLQVAKRLRDIIDTTPQLQYDIELAVAHYINNQQSALTLTEKLWSLREVQNAWKRARFGLGPSMPFEHGWLYAGNVMHREFEFMVLDDSGKDSLDSRRRRIGPGLPKDFLLDSAVDPAQNAVVLLSLHEQRLLLHCMRLSDCAALRDELLEVPWPQHTHNVGTEMKILEHFVAVIFLGIPTDQDAERDGYSMIVMIYNITTGSVVASVASISSGMGSNAHDLFAFISNTSFIVGACGPGSYALQIYSVDPEMTNPYPDGAFAPLHIATYEFPRVLPGCLSTGWFLDESKSSALGTNEPFQPLTSRPILAVKRVYSNPMDHANRMTCVFIIPIKVFIDEIARYKARRLDNDRSNEDHGSRVLPWDAWGPTMVRCAQIASDILTSPRASTSCRGYRLLVHDTRSTVLMDFNSLDIARDLSWWRRESIPNELVGGTEEVERDNVKIEPYSGHIVLLPTLAPRDYFAQDVVTCLPYRETIVEWAERRPFRVIDGSPSLCVVGDLVRGAMHGMVITHYHVLNTNV